MKDYLAGTQLQLVAPTVFGNETVVIFTLGISAHTASISLIARHRWSHFDYPQREKAGDRNSPGIAWQHSTGLEHAT